MDATLRPLGRSGVVELADRTVRLTARFAAALQNSGTAQIVDEVVSHQLLVRWLGEDDDACLDHALAGVREEGAAHCSGTTCRGERLMRISVSDWATDEQDIHRVVEALPRYTGLLV